MLLLMDSERKDEQQRRLIEYYFPRDIYNPWSSDSILSTSILILPLRKKRKMLLFRLRITKRRRESHGHGWGLGVGVDE